MKSKELLLWVIAIFALALSSFAVLGPKINLNPLSSDAASLQYTSDQATVSGGIKIRNPFGKKACTYKPGDTFECTDGDGVKHCYRYTAGNPPFKEINCTTGEYIPVENQN